MFHNIHIRFILVIKYSLVFHLNVFQSYKSDCSHEQRLQMDFDTLQISGLANINVAVIVSVGNLLLSAAPDPLA